MLTSQTLIPWLRPAWKWLNSMPHFRWSQRWEYIRSFHLLTSKHLRQLVTCNSSTCTDMGHCIGPGVSNPAPEEFSSNETHLNQLIKILRITRNFQASVLGQGISPQWSRIGHPWFSCCHLGNAVKCPFSLKSGLINLLDFTSQMSNLKLHSSGYLQIGFGSIPSSGVYGTHYKLIFSAGWWAIKKIKTISQKVLYSTWSCEEGIPFHLMADSTWSFGTYLTALYPWLALGQKQHWLSD